MSPAANTSGWETDCSVSRTAMNPCASVAKPDSPGHAAAPAVVTHRISSSSKRVPSRHSTPPSVARLTGQLVRTSTPRRANNLRNAARTRRLWVGRMSAPSVMSVYVRWSAERFCSARSRRRRYCTDNRSSTPPAPPPTTPMRVACVRARQRVRNASQCRRNPSMGLTGTPTRSAPGMWDTSGVEPTLTDNTS